MEPGSAATLRLLGPASVVHHASDGDVEVTWRGRRALLLVAYLALAQERSATRGELSHALWPDLEAPAGRRRLHPTVSLARRALRSVVVRPIPHVQGVYRLARSVRWDTDVEAFEGAIDRGRERSASEPEESVREWQRAWRLYRGPLLMEELELPWIVRRRRALHRGYLHLLADLGSAYRRLGRVRDAIDAFRALLFQEPLEERTHVALMELYREQGRRDLVRHQYIRLQEALKAMQIEPSEESQRRFNELMR